MTQFKIFIKYFSVKYNLHDETIRNVTNESMYHKIMNQLRSKSLGVKVDLIQRTQRVDRNFTILYWTKSFRGNNWFGEGKSPFESCQYKNCILSSDKNEYNSSDAILVSLHFLHNKEPLPNYRASSKHKWIMRFNESLFLLQFITF